MPDYSALRTKAAASIARAGQSCTLRKQTAGAYDPATSTASVTTADHTVDAVILDFASGLVSRNGTLIQQGDKQALVEAGVAVPALQDKLIVGSVTYEVIGVQEVSPAGTSVLYDLHVRK